MLSLVKRAEQELEKWAHPDPYIRTRRVLIVTLAAGVSVVGYQLTFPLASSSFSWRHQVGA